MEAVLGKTVLSKNKKLKHTSKILNKIDPVSIWNKMTITQTTLHYYYYYYYYYYY